jgi:hypothetical protein
MDCEQFLNLHPGDLVRVVPNTYLGNTDRPIGKVIAVFIGQSKVDVRLPEGHQTFWYGNLELISNKLKCMI